MTAVADRVVVLDGSSVPDREVVGNKGRSIAWMLSLGLPVPPALCLPIDECRRFHAAGGELEAEAWGSVLAGVTGLEEKLGREFGGGEQPLLVSVRSGAAVSMPGMMDTVLNLGITDEVEAALGRLSGDPDFARSTHCRFIHQFGQTVLGADLDEPGEDATPDQVREEVRADTRRGGPARPARAAARRDQHRLRLLVLAPGQDLPQALGDLRRGRHRGDRPGDGLRQPRRGLRHRRPLQPQSPQRPPRALRRVAGEGAGGGRRQRHPRPAAAGRPGDPDARRPRAPARGRGAARARARRRPGHRVHGRARRAVPAADALRQALAAGRRAGRRRPRRRGRDRPRRGGLPGQPRAAGDGARAANSPRPRSPPGPRSSPAASPPARASPPATRSATPRPPRPRATTSWSGRRPAPTTSAA